MSGFSRPQIKKLVGKLDRAHVQSREQDGRRLDYIEGWFAIAEANAIFGFAGWDRQMVHFERVFEARQGQEMVCTYLARIRVTVRAGEAPVVREGTGFGQGKSQSRGEAHERALKAAETDATKRALATFGNRFGLSLYDKEQNGVTPGPMAPRPVPSMLAVASEVPAKPSANGPLSANAFVLRDGHGVVFASTLSAEGFCTGLRQLVEAAEDSEAVTRLKADNAEMLACLREDQPHLKSSKGLHFADILIRLIDRRLRRLAALPVSEPGSSNVIAKAQPAAPLNDGAPGAATTPKPISVTRSETDTAAATTMDKEQLASPSAPSKIADGPAVDKNQLALGTERRVRDKAHLLYVASKPCLVCEGVPSHAHHITFAQRRGLSLKVSDAFTVPLCVIHHNALHAYPNERAFWRQHRIDPLPVAARLWKASCEGEGRAADPPMQATSE